MSIEVFQSILKFIMYINFTSYLYENHPCGTKNWIKHSVHMSVNEMLFWSVSIHIEIHIVSILPLPLWKPPLWHQKLDCIMCTHECDSKSVHGLVRHWVLKNFIVNVKKGIVWGVLGEGTHFFFIGVVTLIVTISSCNCNLILCILHP